LIQRGLDQHNALERLGQSSELLNLLSMQGHNDQRKGRQPGGAEGHRKHYLQDGSTGIAVAIGVLLDHHVPLVILDPHERDRHQNRFAEGDDASEFLPELRLVDR
jgi:hypothetical protein